MVSCGVLFVRLKKRSFIIVSCFGPRIRAMAKVFYRGEADVKYRANAQIHGPKHDTRFWMTSVTPNYNPKTVSKSWNMHANVLNLTGYIDWFDFAVVWNGNGKCWFSGFSGFSDIYNQTHITRCSTTRILNILWHLQSCYYDIYFKSFLHMAVTFISQTAARNTVLSIISNSVRFLAAL